MARLCPYAYNIEKLCAVYGMSATDLGLEQPASEQEANPAFSASMEAQVPMAVRTRVEILTNQTMAALKSPTRDREQTIKCWTASMQGAITLQSQQRFDEAFLAYEVMAGVWPGDKRITELRELTRHW